MPYALHPWGNSPWYPVDRRLGGSQSQSGCDSEEKNSLSHPCQESNPNYPAHR